MDALKLWLELSEVDPGQTRFNINLGGGLCEWTVKRMHDFIKEALELDDSNTTGVLMLDALSKTYFDNRNFSISQLLSDPERTTAYVSKAAALRDLVRAPEFMEQNNRFVSHLRTALKMYGMDTDKTLAMAENLHEIGYLRRDAFRSIQQLRVDQFLSGEPEPAGTKPVYHGWVHQFWNINSLVQAACRQPSGVTLSLVRDPDDLQSYFVFAIRNGGNLFLLSDVPVHAHPLAQYMSRKPERAFDSRTSRNWFPYDLLNLKFDEESEMFFADEARRRSLVPQQQTVDRLKPIGDLDPQEVLWIVMMFDLIVDKFWLKRHQAPALSYTAAMIREERPLIEAAEAANLPVVAYQTLALPALTREDLTAEKVAAAVGTDGGSPNAWLEARYADKVDPELFNLLDNGANKLYLPPVAPRKGERSPREHKNHELAVVTSSYVSVLPKDDEDLPFWHTEGRYGLHALNTTMFGTREELEHNRIFLARYNQAQAINRLADEEFSQRKAEVIKWWSDRVKQNLDYLLSLAAAGTLRRVFEPTGPGCSLETADGYSYADGTFNFVRTFGDDDWYPGASCTLSLHQGYLSGRDKFECMVTGAASSYRVLFQPQNAKQLAELAGCEVSDLPDVLQHWSAGRDHQGNHILDRIDPMAWALRDPWCGVDFRIVLFLSKRGLAQVKKRFPESAAAGETDAAARKDLKGTSTMTIRF
ncbi:hypothetical protein WJ96_05540 [Burkholderia ubonensis]|uniref:Zorya protein ZorC EH domain-containing protein n=2 Tax=Burkholderia ubonensis TaxID=101571 RepID=A0AAW3MXI9_9BURK|nr:hypothetical protein [Burkholderia ubonensis]KVP75220.1 hypothetical protein WJ93_07335 [Burkholderia ubonensis]KVP96691.1 hypothetical protein WJ97_12475 [Burkholderia ubonensis]KVP98033.1 hypothetical protein WJ96_05540 [Burkholderia ubonensis]KVZ92730.1 hypothetical protein WL25_17200 [Burkholderia ubonensis]